MRENSALILSWHSMIQWWSDSISFLGLPAYMLIVSPFHKWTLRNKSLTVIATKMPSGFLNQVSPTMLQEIPQFILAENLYYLLHSNYHFKGGSSFYLFFITFSLPIAHPLNSKLPWFFAQISLLVDIHNLSLALLNFLYNSQSNLYNTNPAVAFFLCVILRMKSKFLNYSWLFQCLQKGIRPSCCSFS